jgi:uncharacterized membrane protein YgcG
VTAAVIALLTLSAAGCGPSAADQVRAKVQEFAHAAATKNYAEICSQVLAPSLVAHLVSAGIPCQAGLQAALGSVKDPTISVGNVRVAGNHAWAVILASARGQRPLVSALALVHTPHGWRIVSLNSPVGTAAGGSGGGGTGTTAGGGTGTTGGGGTGPTGNGGGAGGTPTGPAGPLHGPGGSLPGP